MQLGRWAVGAYAAVLQQLLPGERWRRLHPCGVRRLCSGVFMRARNFFLCIWRFVSGCRGPWVCMFDTLCKLCFVCTQCNLCTTGCVPRDAWMFVRLGPECIFMQCGCAIACVLWRVGAARAVMYVLALGITTPCVACWGLRP
jgi:hypothetical protein